MPRLPTPPDAQLDGAQPGLVRLTGDWSLGHADAVARVLRALPGEARVLDASGAGRLDSYGVLQLLRFARRQSLDFDGFRFDDGQRALVEAIEDVDDTRPPRTPDYGFAAALERLGRAMVREGHEAVALVGFLGENLVKLARVLLQPRRLRLTSVIYHMEQVGLDAVPLVALLSFMVGAVIAFLGATVLRDFGAEIYVVQLVSISFLREFGVLLTAILLAGRTASAFTAQIGAMVNNEEVDAIRTLGLDPIELLVLPRVLALLVMLPLLTLLAMVAGLAGGMMVGAFALDLPPQTYFARMHDTMQLRHFLVGMSKAPLFALVIGLIGCLEGLRVEGSAEAVGRRTTSSVVQTISLVIVLDALAAIWFMEMDW
jgi:phospholipid/cholesterol/gamma-HCH transport system permease protein